MYDSKLIFQYLNSIMNEKNSYSHLYDIDKNSNLSSEWVYNALKKNIAMVMVNCGMLDENELTSLKSPLNIDEFKKLFIENEQFSYFVLSIFQIASECGRRIAISEKEQVNIDNSRKAKKYVLQRM